MSAIRSALPTTHVKSRYPFDEVYRTAKERVPRRRVELRLEQAADWIADLTRHGQRTCCYGWSGGKDSQVLRLACDLAGVKDAVCCITDVEFPDSMAWMRRHAPPGTEFWNSGITPEFVAARPGWLFPRTGTPYPVKWCQKHQWRGQRLFQLRGYDVMLLGRRHADGNKLPKGGVHELKGVGLRGCPLHDWTQEETMAALRWYDLPLPPVYFRPLGWYHSQTAWARREWLDEDDGWDDVYAADPSIVVGVQGLFEGARRCLARHA